MSSLMISSSGIRGIIGESMTPALAVEVASSFGTLIGKGPVVLGGDTRVSHDCIMSAFISGLLSVGTDIIHIGKVTTPTVQQSIKFHKAKAGVVITASHNPIIWNGIKLMNETGSFLSKQQYDQFIETYTTKSFKVKPYDQLGSITYDETAIEQHIDLILAKIDTSAIKNSGLNILIDANNGAGAIANPILCDKLGITYTILNSEPNGIFAHNPEPLKQNLDQIITELKQGSYDIGFVQDADADRLVILDENGTFIGEDVSLALCIDYVLSYEKPDDPNKDVVVNLSTSKVISDIVSKKNGNVYQTRIGEPQVTAKIKELNAVVGGEGNGGVIYPEVGWGRDSLVGIVLALNYLAKSKKSVSEIVKQYPNYTMLRNKLQVKQKSEIQPFLNKVEQHFNHHTINKEDGVKVLFSSGWIHVRPSNTEPIVRIFIEEKNEIQAQNLMEEVLNLQLT